MLKAYLVSFIYVVYTTWFMELIFIYGAPSVGKLTVAKKLAKDTGYKLFHNHLTVNLVKSVFDWGTEEFSLLNRKFRLEMFEEASKKNINGMIFTFCYRPNKNSLFVKNVIKIIEKYGGKVNFVMLKCDEEEVFRRVTSEDRIINNKLCSVSQIKEKMHMWGEIDFVENLIIDNTKISPKNVAIMIKEKYKL